MCAPVFRLKIRLRQRAYSYPKQPSSALSSDCDLLPDRYLPRGLINVIRDRLGSAEAFVTFEDISCAPRETLLLRYLN